MEAKHSDNNNQYALITGGTSGIGYELAKVFAQNRYNLVLVARSNERLAEVGDEFRGFGVDVITIEKDLFQPSAAREIFGELKRSGTRIDILVNNAGQGERGKFHETPLERHLALIQLNIATLVSLTRLFLDDMLASGEGKILNVSSVVSKTPVPEFSVYAASKAFVQSFSEALAQELEDTGVTVTALLPGRTDTDFFYKAGMEDTKEYQDHALANPADVAKHGFDALMSGESRVISGAMNKMMVGMMNTMPDSANAEKMQKNMQKTDKPPAKRKQQPEHKSSRRERQSIGDDQDDRG